MQSSKKVLGLSLVFAALVSTLPASETRAMERIGYGAKYGVRFCAAAAATYLLINFFIRKPLKEKRFDIEKLKNGTAKEKIQHSYYYLCDKIVGWPYKSKKINCVMNEDGKLDMEIEEEQAPGGALGLFQGYVLVGAKKSLWWGVKELGSFAAILYAIHMIGKGELTLDKIGSKGQAVASALING